MNRAATVFQTGIKACLVCIGIYFGSLGTAQGAIPEPLWLSLSPAASNGGPSCHPQAAPARPGNPVSKKKPSQGGRPASRFESEHRPQLERAYYLSEQVLGPGVKAYVQYADASQEKIAFDPDQQGRVVLRTPFKMPSMHGANRLFVVDNEVNNEVLEVRVAQWLTLHHSCAWGHDFRFDQQRQGSTPTNNTPLEIIVDHLWDSNFHVRTASGDRLTIHAYSFGQPVSEVKITLRTETGWVQELKTGPEGTAVVQLPQDYFPAAWQQFNRTQLGQLLIRAEYTIFESGDYLGNSYNRIHLTSTLPWKYTPGKNGYLSYGYGLAIGTVFLSMSGFGVFAYRDRRQKTYRGISFDE